MLSTKFKITDYEDLNKVAMTKVFRGYSDIGFEGSMRMTASLLSNGTLEFEIEDQKSKIVSV